MTWVGESATSGLMSFTDGDSPGEVVGNIGEVLVWGGGNNPAFASQSSLTGILPLVNIEDNGVLTANSPVQTINFIGATVTPTGVKADIQISGGSIVTTNINWVDKNGNDGTALPNRPDLPYLTIAAALAAASSGDTVIVRPGTYAESGLTVPTNIVLKSEGGWEVTTISGASATGTRVTVVSGATIDGFTITMTTDAVPAISVTSASGVATIANITFNGAGASGVGLRLSGAGKIIATEIRYGAGDCDAIIEATAGILALDSCHAPSTAGAVAVGIRLSGGARGQIIHPNMGAPTITTGIQVLDATFIGVGVNLFNMTNALRISDNSAAVQITGGLLDATTFNILVDSGLTGATGVVRLSVHMEPKFSIPDTWFDADHAWTFFTKSDDTENATWQLWGAKMAIGHPEFGSGWSSGEGISYSTNITVLTTDNTASPSSDGGSFIDKSIEAESKSGSTFSFQGLTAGHSILWCTNRTDNTGDKLKSWGVELDQTIAGVGGAYIWEIQTAANTWTEINVMAISNEEGHRYANNVFLRANSDESIFAGIDGSTTWPETTINGTLGHWMRVRIVTTTTTAPVFERMKLIPSHTSVNNRGNRLAIGLAMWTKNVDISQVKWQGNNLTNSDINVGAGGTGWSQSLEKGKLDNTGDTVEAYLIIPQGVCTAHPLTIKLYYGFHSSGGTSSIQMSYVPGETVENLIADPAGGKVPIGRDISVAALTDSLTPIIPPSSPIVTPNPSTSKSNVAVASFTGVDISDYYAGDFIFTETSPTSIGSQLTMIAMSIEGVGFADGNTIT